MYERLLKLDNILKSNPFFLFGPRSTGKSTLIRTQLPNAHVFDLLDRKTYRRFLADPSILDQIPGSEPIVIDEIQKIPTLLDEVHRLIEKSGRRFLLTGSSARKLRHCAANLLGGRAWQAELFPLCYSEIPHFNLIQYLNHGGLPVVYSSDQHQEQLAAYVGMYLQDEIKAEALTRNIEAFSEFLTLSAKSNGQEISYQSFASDCGLSQNTIKNYFQVLTDTLVGFILPAYTKTTKRKAITRSKHYFFDIGVRNALCEIDEFKHKSDAFGVAFEHFLVLELRAYCSYTRNRKQLFYWRSTSQFEVDCIVSGSCALEFKATDHVRDKHLSGLRAFKEEGQIPHYIIVSCDPEERVTSDGIRILPWERFLKLLWSGKLL